MGPLATGLLDSLRAESIGCERDRAPRIEGRTGTTGPRPLRTSASSRAESTSRRGVRAGFCAAPWLMGGSAPATLRSKTVPRERIDNGGHIEGLLVRIQPE